MGALPQPARLIAEPVCNQLASVQLRVLIAIGVSGVGQPTARNSPSVASSSARSVAATIWCTREEEGPGARTRPCDLDAIKEAAEKAAQVSQKIGSAIYAK